MGMILVVILLSSKTKEYVCIHEKRIGKTENRITELEARADFKELRIDELSHKMEEMDKKLDKITESISELQIQSKADDYSIDKRVTSIESELSTTRWILGFSVGALSCAVAVLTFLMTIIH